MLTTILEIILQLSQSNLTTDTLCKEFEISPATLKRAINEARHLGAKIQSVKRGKISEYQLDNWNECRHLTMRWLKLEQERTVIEQKSLDL